jgi:hypothetical protein
MKLFSSLSQPGKRSLPLVLKSNVACSFALWSRIDVKKMRFEESREFGLPDLCFLLREARNNVESHSDP